MFLSILALLLASCVRAEDYLIDDVFTPHDCATLQAGDHLLLEYEIALGGGTVVSSNKAPEQLYHVLFDEFEEWPVMGMLSSMCKNASRRMTWADPSKVHLMPILVKSLPPSPLSLSITIRLVHVTKKEDYAIFDMIAAGDHVGVLNLLAAGAAGVAGGGGGNALDEWGQTPVMIAAQGNKLDLLAPLLNLRQPFVNFNLAKPSGFTALFYAVQQKQATVLTALLQRGADPNALLTVEGSRGTTPLHMACHLEKLKHIEELLKYGARPDATNQHGHVPLQLLPKDALRSTKLYLKKVFEDAMVKWAAKQEAEGAKAIATETETKEKGAGRGSDL